MIFTPTDIRNVEAELSEHLYDKFEPELRDGQVPSDLGERVKEEIRWWSNFRGISPSLHLNGKFECHLQMAFPPNPQEPLRFEVKFVLAESQFQLEGWDEDPLE